MDFVVSWTPNSDKPSNLPNAPSGILIRHVVSPQAGDVQLVVGDERTAAAGVWWDATHNELCLRRDIMGRYPMAWCVHLGTLHCASDVSLLPNNGAVNWDRVSRWLENTDDNGNDDFFDDTFRLSPGELVRWSSPCHPKLTERPLGFGTSMDERELDNAVEAALHATCNDAKKPALMLSDGLDSGLIAAALRQHHSFPTSTMVSRFPDVCRLDLVEMLANHIDAPMHLFDVDKFKPFLNASPWLETPQFGVMQYPGQAYERPFINDLVERFQPDSIWSGIGADQLFYRSPYMLARLGVSYRDQPALDLGVSMLSKKQVLAFSFTTSRIWRRLRLKDKNTWESQVAFLRHPTFESHQPFFLFSWQWEAAMRSLRATECLVGRPIVLPLANERMFFAVSPYSHAQHFGETNKPVLRRIAKRFLPNEIATASKDTSFTPIFEDVFSKFSSKRLASLMSLDQVINSTRAIQDFASDGALTRKARYIVTGDVISALSID